MRGEIKNNLLWITRTVNHLSFLFRFKYVISKELSSHLVYKFSCSSCNATYYGKTERHLNIRAGEHIGLSPLTEIGLHANHQQYLITYYCMSIIIVALTTFQFYFVKITYLSYP